MVLCQETEYALSDEPTNNLGVARSVAMMEHLRHAVGVFGCTILTVLHDINFAAKYSDRICAMKKGRIAAFGEVSEIMSTGLLIEIFEAGIEIIEGLTADSDILKPLLFFCNLHVILTFKVFAPTN